MAKASRKTLQGSLLLVASSLMLAAPACAGIVNLDETANDLVGGGTPAGQPITFNADTVLGALVLCEGAANAAGTACAANIGLSDVVIWFTGIGGQTIFASLESDENEGGENVAGDTVNLAAPDGALYMAEKVVTTVAGAKFEGAIYAPVAGQPGYSKTGNYTYNINSDPEPASLTLFGVGLAALGFMCRRKKA